MIVSTTSEAPLRVAYLINQYPQVSHSFVRREILALESFGVMVDRYAIRGWGDVLADPADIAERARTTYLLKAGGFGLVRVVLREAVCRPLRFWRAFGEAVRLSRGAERPLFVHFAYLAEAAVLAQALSKSGAKHIHAHFGTNSATVAYLAVKLGAPGYSFTAHGPEEFDKPAAISLAKKVESSRFVVAISSFCRSQLFRWTSIERWSSIHVVRCGLDRSFLDAETVEPVPATPVSQFVCVGRLCEQKGQLLLVDALQRLRSRGVNVNLVLAGDGEMRPVIEARAREAGVSEQIRITGWISGEQVRAELRAARAMVLPSFAEGLPVVLMEAMALGRPVISTYVAGIPELVIPEDNGWLVPPGDVDALADVMERCLLSSPSDLTEMGRRGRRRVLERHDVVREASRLHKHFKDAIA